MRQLTAWAGKGSERERQTAIELFFRDAEVRGFAASFPVGALLRSQPGWGKRKWILVLCRRASSRL